MVPKQFPQVFCRAANTSEISVGGIEVEDHLVGAIRLIHAAQPRVRRDDRLIGKIHKGSRIAANDVPNNATLFLEQGRFNPAGIVRGCFLLEKPWTLDTVRISFHRDGPPP